MRGIELINSGPGVRDMTPAAIVPAGQWDLLPGGHRVKGVNISPVDKVLGVGVHGSWPDLWQSWPWDSSTGIGTSGYWNIKDQIDKAQSVYGANTIRFFGSQSIRYNPNSYWATWGYGSPYMSLSTYLTQWGQLADYIRAKGMYLYPCLGGDSNISYSSYGWTPPTDWLTAEMVTVARFLQQYVDIIPGIDISNESAGWWHSTPANAISMYQAVKAAAPKLKFTWSSVTSAGDVPPAGGRDFLDFHDYTSPSASYYDNYLTTYNIPVMIGEFGQVTTGSRATKYNQNLACANYVTSGRKLAGSFAWTMYPQDSTSGSTDYGLCDTTGTPRTDVQSIFTSYPN